MFALTVPGLARLTGRELATLDAELGESGNDGRADVLLFDLARAGQSELLGLRTAEDVFVEVGRTFRSEGDNARWIAARIWKPERVEKALSVWSELVRPLRAAMTYRVIVRVQQERSFLRTELRRQMTRAIGAARPKWRVADPAVLEIWVIEYQPGKIIAGLRLSTSTMRQHDGRAAERSGALRPAVAAAMVQQAGPGGGVLLDPCCGSGTILSEALAEGWSARGSDVDPDAVATSSINAPRAKIELADARDLPLHPASVDACVSNLPFGEQYTVPGDPTQWLAEVMAEMARVTKPGSRVVVVRPEMPSRGILAGLTLSDRTAVRLLGMKTTIWAYDRA